MLKIYTICQTVNITARLRLRDYHYHTKTEE